MANKTLTAEASVNDKIKNALNIYTPLLRTNFKKTFVTLQGGKSLSTNDFTNAYKSKLDSIEAGAQKNMLNGVTFKGAEYNFDTATKIASVTITGGNNFVVNNHTVKSASISGADISFESETAVISVTGGGENISVNGSEVSAISVVGGNVSVESDTAIISIAGGDGENISVNGSEVSAISVVGGNVSVESDTAVISITGGDGGNFTVNGSEVTAMSVVGAASVTTSSDTAVVSIPAAVNEVTVVGGALQASIDGSKLYLQNADRQPKQSANFALSPSNITLDAFQPATITASHTGDGTVQIYSDRFVQSEQLNANQFRISPKYAGQGNIGFYLSETEDYYGAAANVSITAESDNSMPVLMHFDDAENPFANEGFAEFTTDTSSTGTVTINSDYGKFGNGICTPIPCYSNTLFPLGGKDFSISFWAKSTLGLGFSKDNGNTTFVGVIANSSTAISLAIGSKQTASSKYLLNSEMQHIAVVYRHDLGKLRLFYNGVKLLEVDATFERVDINTLYLSFYGAYSIMDELLILDGVAQYWEDFTPPVEPF